MCFTATVNKGRARGATSLRRSGTSEADRTSLLMGASSKSWRERDCRGSGGQPPRSPFWFACPAATTGWCAGVATTARPRRMGPIFGLDFPEMWARPISQRSLKPRPLLLNFRMQRAAPKGTQAQRLGRAKGRWRPGARGVAVRRRCLSGSLNLKLLAKPLRSSFVGFGCFRSSLRLDFAKSANHSASFTISLAAMLAVAALTSGSLRACPPRRPLVALD